MNKILLSIVKKEFIHIWKDPQSLLVVILLPIIMLLLFGYAITLEMRNIPLVVSDLCQKPESRLLIDRISASGFFKVQKIIIAERDVDKIFQRRMARVIIVIPEDYARKLQRDVQTDLQVLIDASDPNSANLINNYLNVIIYGLNKDNNGVLPVPFTVEPRFLYNPELKSANFFVPGLIAIILLLVSALLTSIAIAREKETGTMEQILVSPIRPEQIVIGKVIPYLLLAFLSGIIILFTGVFLFKVPFAGFLPTILFTMLLYIFTGLSFGLLISTIAKSQMVAMLLTLVATMLPTIMLSGFIFPVDSMPYLFRIISLFIPANHFIYIIRGIMLKGLGLADLLKQITFLVLLSALLIIVSLKKFKNNLE